MKNIFYYDTKIGMLGIGEDNGCITNIVFGNTQLNGYEKNETDIIKKAIKQLSEYFDGKRKRFDLQLNPQGTVFQKKVWQALLSIPYGRTATYKEIAEKCGCFRGYRAVGMANNKNPIPIIVPCHRVIGSNGKLVGYAGGLSMKEQLLQIENQNSEFLLFQQ